MRWQTSLTGLLLSVFALVCLSGPGRIDIVDGQARYEVARSLVEHGDLVIRDPNVWFSVLPGRDGRLYSNYRFPHSLVGVVAILAADAVGPVSESRRHFFFTLIGAVACAGLAVCYAVLFRRLGEEPRCSLLWAAGGIICTPCWFYGTSTFDDILGSVSVVLAITVALASRHRRPRLGALVAGLTLGLAFNCKQPLGIFVLAVLAAIYDPALSWRTQWGRLGIILATLLAAIAVYKGYEWYKFPPGSTAGHAELLKKYVPTWPGHPVTALVALTLSLGTGVFFYNPTLVLGLVGMRGWFRPEPLFCLSLGASITVFTLFFASVTAFKGDPAWGPRYFTPIFAVLWIFAPAGAAILSRRLTSGLLLMGFVVQLGALSIEPSRLYIEHGLPSAFYVSQPDLYFHPAISHLVNRPREIREVLFNRGERAEFYTPSPSPTFAFPVLDFVDKGPAAIRKYHILNSFRPWWISFRYLDDKSQPVNIDRTVLFLASLALGGLLLVALGLLGCRHPDPAIDESQSVARSCGAIADDPDQGLDDRSAPQS